ncbi:MAG: DNA-deoxyinosine glycosylase [Treponemataceae bacterium]
MSVFSGLPPLVGPNPRFLLLGSFPSVASLEKREYYGFGRNHFWFLAASVFGESLPASWPEKAALLSRNAVAVWDVTASCAREGSLDQAIRGARPNPIPAFLVNHPSLERVVLNGSKAAELFVRFFLKDGKDGRETTIPLSPEAPINWEIPDSGGRLVRIVRVPSSSPVPSREYRSAGDKFPAWKAAFTL